MERLKKENYAPVVSDFLRVGMWKITPDNDTINLQSGVRRRVYRYGTGDGSGVVIVDGDLLEEDRGVFLNISNLDQQNHFNGIEGHIIDLAKLKGVKNPYQPSVTNPIWDSIDRLLDVNIRIRPNVRGGSVSAGFRLVTGKLDSDGTYFLITHDYWEIAKQLNLYTINVPLNQYFSLKSPIARSVSEFLRTQKLRNTKRGYSISLSKLCEYIGYTKNVPFWELWQTIKRSLNELIESKFISKFERNINHKKNEGGIITFWSLEEKEKSVSNKTTNKDKNTPPDFIVSDGHKYERKPSGRFLWWNEHEEKFDVLENSIIENHKKKHNWCEPPVIQIKFLTSKKENDCPHKHKFGKDYCQFDCCLKKYCGNRSECSRKHREIFPR